MTRTAFLSACCCVPSPFSHLSYVSRSSRFTHLSSLFYYLYYWLDVPTYPGCTAPPARTACTPAPPPPSLWPAAFGDGATTLPSSLDARGCRSQTPGDHEGAPAAMSTTMTTMPMATQPRAAAEIAETCRPPTGRAGWSTRHRAPVPVSKYTTRLEMISRALKYRLRFEYLIEI